MTNKLVVIINCLKVPKIQKILLYEMKFTASNYSCLQNPWLRGYRPQIPALSLSSNESVELPTRTKFQGTPLAEKDRYSLKLPTACSCAASQVPCRLNPWQTYLQESWILNPAPGLLSDARSSPVTATAGLAKCEAQNTTYTSKASRIEVNAETECQNDMANMCKSSERPMQLPRYYFPIHACR